MPRSPGYVGQFTGPWRMFWQSSNLGHLDNPYIHGDEVSKCDPLIKTKRALQHMVGEDKSSILKPILSKTSRDLVLRDPRQLVRFGLRHLVRTAPTADRHSVLPSIHARQALCRAGEDRPQHAA